MDDANTQSIFKIVFLLYIMLLFGKIKHIQVKLFMNVIMVLKRYMAIIESQVNVSMVHGQILVIAEVNTI